MDTKTIAENGLVGYRVETIQQVIKAQEAGLSIIDKYGDAFNHLVEEEDCDREPTEAEIFERIQQAVKDGQEIYAAFYLDCGKVVPEANTTLQSKFFVGQYVYTMHDNKIVKAKIGTIQMAMGYRGRNIEQRAKYLLTFPSHAVELAEGEFFATKQELLNKLAEGED